MVNQLIPDSNGSNKRNDVPRNVRGAMVEGMKAVLEKEQDHGHEENASEKAETGCVGREDRNEEPGWEAVISGEEVEIIGATGIEIAETAGSDIQSGDPR